MPVPNRKAVEYAIRLGLALNCEIDLNAMWTRKNYFYPDLPKGYQITQTGGLPVYDHPICKNGWIEVTLEDGTVLQSSQVRESEMPVYNSDTLPTKATSTSLMAISSSLV